MSGPPARLALRAPAKLNFGLRILGRRPDGYHLLESLFVPLHWGDDVVVERVAEAGVDLTLSGPARGGLPVDDSNLAARAARLFRERSGLGGGLRLRLHKRIPAGAGLGGGSSDAGAVLRALQGLAPEPLPPGALEELALELGADVPFFLDPRPSLVSGIGEVRDAVPGWPGLWLALANPGESLATAAVYAAWDRSPAALTPSRPGSTMPALSRVAEVSGPRSALRADLHAAAPTKTATQAGGPGSPRRGDLGLALAALLVNDLEAPARELCPALDRWSRRLRATGALATGMSGSGATLFAVYGDEVEARSAAAELAGTASGQDEVEDEKGRGETRAPSGAWVQVVRSAASEDPGAP